MRTTRKTVNPRKAISAICLLGLCSVIACGLPGKVLETPTIVQVSTPTSAPKPHDEEPPGLTPAATTTPQAIPFECPSWERVVALLLHADLAKGIQESLDQFKVDLCEEGYAAVVMQSPLSTPAQVRAFLADLYEASEGRLAGAILIGDLPHAYQWVTLTSANPDIPSIGEEAISFQYYADLDGVFEQSPGYSSPGGHAYSYDLHTGDTDWEIWLGVLPPYKADESHTIEALNRYFANNHAYRSGEYAIGHGFLQVSEHFTALTPEEHDEILEGMRSGTYSWTPFSLASGAQFFFNSIPGDLSIEDGYASLSAGVADFFVGDAHGYWGGHGILDVAWLESNPIRTVFFWSNGCAVGNLDFADNFLASTIYSPTSLVLVAKGTTNNSGGMGTNLQGFFGHNIASAMSEGSTFGDAILSHVNEPLIDPWAGSREFHYATVVIVGDPTLGLQP